MEPRALADAYFGLLDALRELLGGEVDLVMTDAVTNPYIVREIERTKQLLYEVPVLHAECEALLAERVGGSQAG
jgi:hypothetical protein